MTSDTCLCGKPIKVQIFKGTGRCSGQCSERYPDEKSEPKKESNEQ